MNTTKKTAFGIAGVAAASLLTVGLATPAFANTSTDSTSSSYSTTDNSQVSKNFDQTINRVTEILDGTYSPSSALVVSPSVNVSPTVGDIGNVSNVGNGGNISNVGNGGNDNAIGSADPVSTANGTSILNGSGNGTTATNSQGNANSSTVSSSTGQIGSNVDQTVNGILGNLGLSSH